MNHKYLSIIGCIGLSCILIAGCSGHTTDTESDMSSSESESSGGGLLGGNYIEEITSIGETETEDVPDETSADSSTDTTLKEGITTAKEAGVGENAIENYLEIFDNDGSMGDLVTIEDYIQVDLTGRTIPITELEPTQEEINQYEDIYISSNKILNTSPTLTVATGSYVNYTSRGTIDGDEISLLTTSGKDGVEYYVGTALFTETFDDKLIGRHPGDTVSFSITFPDDYNPTDMAGKTAEISLTINGIYEKPEFNDEFVSANTEYQTVQEFEDAYKAEYKNNQLNQYTNTLFTNMVNSFVIYPADIATFCTNYEIFLDYNQYISEQETSDKPITWKKYIEQTYVDTQDYYSHMSEKGNYQSAVILTYAYIAKTLDVHLSDEEYNAWLISADDSMRSEIAQYGEKYGRVAAYDEKVFNALKNNFIISD